MRGSNGRFRQTTLEDIGMGVCKICRKIIVPDLDQFKGQEFIDPRALRDATNKKMCPDCEKNSLM